MSISDHFLTEIFSDLPLIKARRLKLDEGWKRFIELDALTDKLEKEAGIDEKTKSAFTVFYRTDRTFFPALALGSSPKGDHSWAECHDKCRTLIRDTYFAVEDIELRKRLLSAQSATELYFRDLVLKLHFLAYNDVKAAAQIEATESKLRRFFWSLVFIPIAAVELANHFGGITWAAIVSWATVVLCAGLLVQIINEKAEVSRINSLQLRQALLDLEDSALSASVLRWFPYFFSTEEIERGCRNGNFFDGMKATEFVRPSEATEFPRRGYLKAWPNEYRRERDGGFGGGFGGPWFSRK